MTNLTPEIKRSIQSYARYVFRPIFFIALGGIAVEVLYFLRAHTYLTLGFLPDCLRSLAIDFLSDRPKPPTHLFPDIPPSVWKAVELQAGEQCLLLPEDDCPALAERVKRGDSDVSWHRELIPVEVLKTYVGGEGNQVPIFARYFLLGGFISEGPGELSLIQKLQVHLASLSPRGEALHRLRMKGVPSNSIEPDPAIAVVIWGGGRSNR